MRLTPRHHEQRQQGDQHEPGDEAVLLMEAV
jgi:hypothetical protein